MWCGHAAEERRRGQGDRSPLQGGTLLAAPGENAQTGQDAVRGRAQGRDDQADRGPGRQRGLLHQARPAEPLGRVGSGRVPPRHLPGQRRRRRRQARPARRLPEDLARLGHPVPRRLKQAAKGPDDKTYGVPISTDTRGLWYSKDIFDQGRHRAAVAAQDLGDVLAAARAIKQKVPGVVPVQHLLQQAARRGRHHAGLRDAALRHPRRHALRRPPEEVGRRPARACTDSLGFINTIYREELGPDRRTTRSTPSSATRSSAQLLPSGKLAHRPRRLVADRQLEGRPAPSRGRSGPQTLGRPRCRPRTVRRPARSACPAAGSWRSARSPRTRSDAPGTFIARRPTRRTRCYVHRRPRQIADAQGRGGDPAYTEEQPDAEVLVRPGVGHALPPRVRGLPAGLRPRSRRRWRR